MTPSLPQYDAEPDRRGAAIAAARVDFKIDRDFGDLPFPRNVPLSQKLTPRYLAAAGRIEAHSYGSIAGSYLAHLKTDPHGGVSNLVKRFRRRLYTRVQTAIHGPHHDNALAAWQERTPLQIEEFEAFFSCSGLPQSRFHWRSDAYFAWMRLGGVNPWALSLVEELPDRFPLTATRFGQATGGMHLDAALREHRVFLADYALMDGLEGSFGEGYRQYLCAPMALFALPPDRSRLLPVAIKCHQAPDADIWLPSDGIGWRLAKMVFNGSETNYQGVVQHGTRCHMVMGAWFIGLNRSLAPWHPLHILLTPHFECTLQIDELTKGLFLPYGRTPTIQSISEDSTLELSRRGLASFDFRRMSGPSLFGERGILDPEVLPHYPVRNDALPQYFALRRFAGSYVRLYYSTDADVVADSELQGLVRNMEDPGQAGLKGVGPVAGIEDLVELVTAILFRAQTLHASVNYSNWDNLGFIPNAPMGQYRPAPRRDEELTEDDLLMMLPPRWLAYRQFDDVYTTSMVRLNRMGHYPEGWFRDRRVRPLVKRLQGELDQIEFDIDHRNEVRDIPYMLCKPSLVPRSVHI